MAIVGKKFEFLNKRKKPAKPLPCTKGRNPALIREIEERLHVSRNTKEVWDEIEELKYERTHSARESKT